MQNPLYNLTIKTPRLTLRVPHARDIVDLGIVAASGIQKPEEPHFHDEHLYEKSPEKISAWIKESVAQQIEQWNTDN